MATTDAPLIPQDANTAESTVPFCRISFSIVAAFDKGIGISFATKRIPFSTKRGISHASLSFPRLFALKSGKSRISIRIGSIRNF